MTNRAPAGHSPGMRPGPTQAEPGRVADAPAPAVVPTFDEVYDEYFDFVWDNVRRLGVHAANVEDTVQNVFLVVHRRLGEFEGRSSLRTWLFGIAYRVVRDHRRTLRRKGGGEVLDDELADHAPGPDARAERAEALQVLLALLDEIDDDRRAVFVMAEVEQMSGREIAEALGIPENTVSSRLRVARQEFEKAVARHHRRSR